MAIDITTPDVDGDADLTSWAAVTRAAGFDTWVATPTSANLRALITDEVGTGGLYFVGGALGTPASVTLTNATGLPVSTGLTGLGTGVATALGVNVGSAGAPVLFNGALGTPSSATLTNATGLPISTGVSGLGTGIATFLATPSSANLRAAVTDESGSGALLFAGGALGTPASGVLTNCTGLPNASVVGLGTAALVADNTLVHLAGAETISGAKTFSTSPIITASLDMRNDIRMTDAGTNRWAIGRGAGGGGAADDWQLYNYSGAVALRVTYSGNVASFTNTPLVGSDPVMTRGATETVTGIKTFSNAATSKFTISGGTTNDQNGFILASQNGGPAILFTAGRNIYSATDYGFTIFDMLTSRHVFRYNAALDQCGIQSAYNATTGLGANLFVNSDGILYRSTSSEKYKRDIQGIDDAWVEKTLESADQTLIWYASKSANDDPSWHWAGMSAEKLAEQAPHFVQFRKLEDGSMEPEGVDYARFVVPLIRKVMMLERRLAALEAAQ